MTSSRNTAARRRTRAVARQMTQERPAGTYAPPDVPDDEGLDGVRPSPRWPAVAGIVICALGLADAAYLTYAHYTSASNLACSTHGLFDCAAVTTSRYSHIFGFPVSVLGLIYFAFMLPLMLPAAWRSPNVWLRRVRLAAAVVGVGMIVWLIYVELVKLDQICEYCTGVHILTFALFVVVLTATLATAPDPEH